MKRLFPLLAAIALCPLSGCLSHAVHVEPITVAPMRVQMDVNLHVDDERASAAAPTAEGGSVSPAEGAAASPAASTAAAAH